MAHGKEPVLFTVGAPLPVTRQQVDDILTIAFEGGINYWATKVDVPDDKFPEGATYASEVVSRGGTLDILEDCDGVSGPRGEGKPKWHTLTLRKIKKGITLAIAKYPGLAERFAEEDGFHGDAGEADIIVQYALFGSVIYG